MYKEIKLDYESLEPYISNRTLLIHYNIYLDYLNNLNNILIKNNYDFKYNKEELFDHIDEFELKDRDQIIYNLGGVLNHELYFNSIDNKNNILTGDIKEKIENKYGNYNNFKNEFKKNAKELVGSGYTNLVLNKDKELQIINTSNQESPYLYGMIPILTLDLWEHAYYLDYQNNKDLYIDNFFQIIDFEKLNEKIKKNK